jgi:GTPase KRas protein
MFVQNLFQDYYEPTLEDNYRKCMTTVGKQSCLIDVTDTSGFNRYAFLLESELRRADAFVCMYAVDDLSSYESMDGYIKKIRLIKPNAPIILVGNKIDLESGPL